MKKKISERTLTSKQAITQMNNYWKDLHHALNTDAEKKKSMDMRFGIKDIKLDRSGNIISFNKYKRGQFEQQESKIEGFSKFLEAKQKTAVFSFGRFNPPTIGHQKLLQKIIQTSRKESGYACLFVSISQDAKKNPLSASKKITYIKKMFPKEARQIQIKDSHTVLDALVELNDKYDRIVMVVGSDRVGDFKSLLNKYNGVDSQHGYYKYEDIQIVSAGERDPDAEGASGMSASKMRAAAASSDYDSFALGMPDTFKDGQRLYKDIRLAMNIKEQLKPFKPVAEMNSNEFVREQYFQNLIYNIGDWVKDVKTGVIGEVVKRGTNYVTLVEEDFTLHKVWLEDAQSMEKQHKKLPEAVNFLKNRNLWEKLQREGRKRDDEEGTPELTKKWKKLTPNESIKESKEDIKKFASKFKIPFNVATAIWKKLVHAGVNPLTIQNYSVLLTTYINLMDEKMPEVAPPGKEKMIKKLKKKYGDDSDIPFKIAWSQHNQEKG
jgi:phosphopantetheine adenylyltransferase